MSMTTQQIDAFLAQPLMAVIATVDDGGRARQAPVWFHWADGAAYVFTGRGSLKWRNIERRPHASLTIDRREPPYAAVVLDGPVEPSDRPLYDLVLAMATAYYGEQRGREFAEEYRDNAGAVAFKIVPRHIASWDYRERDEEAGNA
jgi:PPOX class probable F420-dependent enzyme